MRKVLSKLALAAAALAGASTSANAFIILTLKDLSNPASEISCDTFVGGCAAGFNVIDADNLSFTGTVGNFTVSNTSTTSNVPGNPNVAFVAASTTNIVNIGGGVDMFEINVRSFNFTLPAGEVKTFRGSASQTSSIFAAGDQIRSDFTVDPENTGALLNGLSCTLNVTSNSSCNTGAPILWSDPAAGSPFFSIRDVQTFTLAAGSMSGSTSTAIVGRIPEPMTTSLVGAALLGLALASRRKAKAA